jgi:FkbM family methyltransferase
MGDLARKMQIYRRNWALDHMRGSHECLKLNLHDLPSLDFVMGITPGRSVAIQAGGNLGLFPKRLAEEFELVYTFEPDPGLFAILRHNASEQNIWPVQAALGDSNNPVGLKRCRRSKFEAPVHEGLTHVSGDGDIPQVRIDDLYLKACDLIYLDIEGYELNALRGAEQTLRRFMPILAVESNACAKHYGHSREELHEWIVAHGYKKKLRMRGDDVYAPQE